ncbi:MAG: hypothetical protein Q9191_001357 [Dirinaria sp. TL-2023a]
MRLSSIIPFILAPAALGVALAPRKEHDENSAAPKTTVTSTAITTVTHSALPSGTGGSLKLIYENGTHAQHVPSSYQESEAEKKLDKRKKRPKVSIRIERGGDFKRRDKDDAIDIAEDVLDDYGYKSGVITHRWHRSNGEDIYHFTIRPDGGRSIHVYEDDVVTQGDQRRKDNGRMSSRFRSRYSDYGR